MQTGEAWRGKTSLDVLSANRKLVPLWELRRYEGISVATELRLMNQTLLSAMCVLQPNRWVEFSSTGLLSSGNSELADRKGRSEMGTAPAYNFTTILPVA